MVKGRLLSRFSAMALAAAMLLAAVAMPNAQAAPKKAPNTIGKWHFTLNSQQLKGYLVELIVESQNKKNGKIAGNGFSLDGEFTFKGKIKPNGKLKTDFDTQLGENDINVALEVKVARNGNTAEGTFKVTGEGGIPLDNGTVEGEKQIEE